MSEKLPESIDSKILIYQSDSGETRLEVRLQDETVWLTQNLMAELYQTTKQNISLHIQNIYEEGELDPEATVKKYLTVRHEGARTVKRPLDYYNLDLIISVGYRVRSGVATRFRQWATARLREYIVKGFTLDDERLKGGSRGRSALHGRFVGVRENTGDAAPAISVDSQEKKAGQYRPKAARR